MGGRRHVGLSMKKKDIAAQAFDTVYDRLWQEQAKLCTLCSHGHEESIPGPINDISLLAIRPIIIKPEYVSVKLLDMSPLNISQLVILKIRSR
jgi:hypothetical protein